MWQSPNTPALTKAPLTGTDDFAKLIQNKSYQDKTLAIKEFVLDPHDVVLVTRQRRDGKSTLLSSQYYFLSNHPDIANDKTKELFRGLKISEDVEFCEQYQNKFPMIRVTLKDLQRPTFNGFLENFSTLIRELYSNHRYLLQSEHLVEDDKAHIRKYITVGSLSEGELSISLKLLSQLLFKHDKKPVYILIDEYDSAINYVFNVLLTEKNNKAEIEKYLNELTMFFKNFFGAALKSNPALAKGLLVGILRVSKNQMLSSLNNLRSYGVLDKPYAEYFGFTEDEVKQLLKKYHFPDDALKEVKDMYNGYTVGGFVLYNPWSVMQYLTDRQAKVFWLMTGLIDNTIKNLLLDGAEETKRKVRKLIAGEELKNISVSESIGFEELYDEDIDIREMSLWTLLLYSGFLTASTTHNVGTDYVCTIRIPNNEVRYNYTMIFGHWLKKNTNKKLHDDLLQSLLKGDINIFTNSFGKYILTSSSLRDFQAESDYQALFIGLLFNVQDSHEVKSNIEMGLGYPDFIVCPRTGNGELGIIIELKHLDPEKKPKLLIDRRTALENLVKEQALAQIEEKHYIEYFTAQFPHVKKILKLGIVFGGKMMVCAYRVNDVNKPYEKTTITVVHGFKETALKAVAKKIKAKLKKVESDSDEILSAEEEAPTPPAAAGKRRHYLDAEKETSLDEKQEKKIATAEIKAKESSEDSFIARRSNASRKHIIEDSDAEHDIPDAAKQKQKTESLSPSKNSVAQVSVFKPAAPKLPAAIAPVPGTKPRPLSPAPGKSVSSSSSE